MSRIRNESVPGLAEFEQEIEAAKQNHKHIELFIAGSEPIGVKAADLRVNNGTVVLTDGGSRTVVPFHAIQRMRIS